MARHPEPRLELAHLEGAYALLELLQVGFVVLDPDGEVHHATSVARQLLGRRLDGAAVTRALGDAYGEVVAPVAGGATWTTRWREQQVARRAGDALDVAVRAAAVAWPDGRRGVLLALDDVSVEVGLHRRYKELLARQEAINEELRRRIAEVLREHEDDLAQFEELVQIAPAIFASFVGEAEAAVTAAARIAGAAALTDDAAIEALREAHTLKGNARSLGLNFIAGRAHAVEDLIAAARRAGEVTRRADLDAAIADLRRAIARAALLHRGMTAAAEDARPDGAADGAAAPAAPAGIALAQLGRYLRAAAYATAAATGTRDPIVIVRGEDLIVPEDVHDALQAALPHLVRNAVVHGAARTITVEARRDGDALVITVADDGRGVDRAALEEALAATGVTDAAERELADLVFHPGLSTRDGIDLDAGRGIGAAAARDAIEAIGGALEVASAPGRGARFTARIPTPAR